MQLQEIFYLLIQDVGLFNIGVLMNVFKKLLLSLLVFVPISSISFAARSELSIQNKIKEIGFDVLYMRILEGDLSSKYFNYIHDQGILNYSELLLEENNHIRKSLIRQFSEDESLNLGSFRSLGK